MAVIINDFEISVEPPQPASASAQPAAQTVVPPLPEEIAAVVEWQRARLARVRAS